jgi:BASS family bile acid:Na+ symporter
MLLAGVFFVQHYHTIVDNFMRLGISITLILMASLATAWLMATVTRLREQERRTIVIEVGMQNAAQAIAIASSPFVFNDGRMAIPAIIYALLMNVALLTYVAFLRRS